MRKTIPTLTLFCIVGLVCSCGLSKEEKEAAEIPSNPQLTSWLSEETFETIRPVSRVEGSIKGVVPVRRLKTNTVFSAELELFEEVPVGSKVRVSKMNWPISNAQRFGPDSEHPIITEVLPEK